MKKKKVAIETQNKSNSTDVKAFFFFLFYSMVKKLNRLNHHNIENKSKLLHAQ